MKATEELDRDEMLLIVEVKTRHADAAKAITRISAYLEAAAKKRLGGAELRGMLVMQSKFTTLKLTADGKAVVVAQDLPMCGSECEEFLLSIARH